jgi:Calpain family cysteine protease/RTX calcium-binding nonapeptide repeat (4 copies)/Bacterial pre-peptidase C-terminal domain
MFGPSNDGSLYILDDQSNTFSLQPNILTPYPGGLLGLAGNDNITGSVSPEIINGNQGDDLILGQGGADTLYGGQNNDTLNGGDDDDLLFGNKDNDRIDGGLGNDNLFGGQADDFIIGNSGNDQIFGDLGNDTLTGGAGQDTLTGGDGADVFILEEDAGVTATTADVITDFDNTSDSFAFAGGISKADITLEQTSDGTLIKNQKSGTVLAKVAGVSPQQLSDYFPEPTSSPIPSPTPAPNPSPTPAPIPSPTPAPNPSPSPTPDPSPTPTPTPSVSNFIPEPPPPPPQPVPPLPPPPPPLGLLQGISGNDTLEGSLVNGTNENFVLSGVLANQTVTVQLNSTEFDPKLQIVDRLTGNVIAENSDISSTDTDSELSFKAQLGQKYDIVVVSENGQSGNYTLTTSTSPRPVGELALNQTINADLSGTDDIENPLRNRSFSEDFRLTNLPSGEEVAINLNSGNFDTYLQLINSQTGQVVTENDDVLNASPPTDDSQINFTPEAGVEYIVRVTSSAENTTGNYTLTATTSTPTPVPSDFFSTLTDDQLEAISRDKASDGELSRQDMLDIFADAQDGGIVDANELQDLQKIIDSGKDQVNNSTPFTMKDSTSYLSNKVVEDVKTNNSITTAIDKWFKGTDRPPASFTPTGGSEVSLQYAPLQGSLYGSDGEARIRHIDQGQFADCTPLAILGATFGSQTSDANNRASSVIQNMIEDNGDGTYTIRFYNGSSPEYVTVDNQVVTLNGQLYGARTGDGGVNSNNPNNAAIWVPLVEKAYAKWYQDSKGVANGYNGIGNTASLNEVFPGITGLSVKDSLVSSTPFDQIQSALSNGKFVTVGSNNEAEKNSSSLISGSSEGTHAYSVTNAYVNPSGEQRIIVHNPWGFDGYDFTNKAYVTRDGDQDGFIDLSYNELTSYFYNVVITV